MQIPKQFSGKLNLDNVMEAIPEGDYMFMLDGMIGTSYDGKRGSVENVIGDSAVTVYGENYKCIGGCRDVSKSRHFLFLCDTDSTDHKIVEVKQNDNGSTSTRDLYSGSYLNFDVEFPVQATYVNGYIYYTDNYDPIKSARVWEAGQTPDWSNLMKRGGIYAPTFAKSTDSSVSLNLIDKKSFQFAYQYVYYNNEISVLSPYSTLCPPNLASETFNKITVSLPAGEVIPSRVKTIKFAVRVGNMTSFQYIGSIDRVGELGSFPTTSIAFYNSVYGGVVEVDYENNEHSVPIQAKTIEFIKNRLWLGNLVEGYSRPAKSGLVSGISTPTITASTTIVEDVSGGQPIYANNTQFYSGVKLYNYSRVFNGDGTVTITFTGETTESQNLVSAYNSGSSAYGQKVSYVVDAYEYVVPSAFSRIGNLPANTQSTSLYPFGAANQVTVADFSGGTLPAGLTLYRINGPFTGTLRTFTPPGSGAIYNGLKTFSNNSTYRIGLIYKDEDGRSSSVVVADKDINTSSSVYASNIAASWTVPSGPAPSIIPSWAKTYHIVMSKNITKSFFIELRAARINYYKGTSISAPTYSVDNTGIEIDITPYSNIGFSYSYSDGDRVIIYKPDGTNTYNLEIKEFTGSKILLDNADIASISNQTPIIEIYRPKVVTEDVIYYEIGQGYDITNPGESDRSFSTTTGSVSGDSYNLLRDTYYYSGSAYIKLSTQTLFKQMSYDIKVPDWNTDGGKAYIVSDKDQITRPYTFRHSGLFIDGTKVNGLSEFYSADEANVSYENGEIMKLKSANRTASEGTVLLAICRERVASIYVDESRLRINAQNDFLVTGSQVIGEISTLQGWYGTNHPSSVFDDGKNVYWYSQIKRAFVRYASNGIFQISELNVSDFFSDVSSRDITDDLTVVCGGYFPYYDIIMVTINHSTPYDLVPYANNALEKTISYSDTNQGWIGFHSIIPDYYLDISDKMLTFRGGTLYRHDNAGAFGSYADENYYTRLRIPINSNPLLPKVWRMCQLFASHKFITTSGLGGEALSTVSQTDIKVKFNAEDRSGVKQSTSTYINEMYVSDSVIYVPIGFDENSDGGWAYGADMVSPTIMVDLEFKSDAFRYISLLNIGFIPGAGHDL